MEAQDVGEVGSSFVDFAFQFKECMDMWRAVLMGFLSYYVILYFEECL